MKMNEHDQHRTDHISSNQPDSWFIVEGETEVQGVNVIAGRLPAEVIIYSGYVSHRTCLFCASVPAGHSNNLLISVRVELNKPMFINLKIDRECREGSRAEARILSITRCPYRVRIINPEDIPVMPSDVLKGKPRVRGEDAPKFPKIDLGDYKDFYPDKIIKLPGSPRGRFGQSTLYSIFELEHEVALKLVSKPATECSKCKENVQYVVKEGTRFCANCLPGKLITEAQSVVIPYDETPVSEQSIEELLQD